MDIPCLLQPVGEDGASIRPVLVDSDALRAATASPDGVGPTATPPRPQVSDSPPRPHQKRRANKRQSAASGPIHAAVALTDTTAFPGGLDTFPELSAVGGDMLNSDGKEHDALHDKTHKAVRAIQERLGTSSSVDELYALVHVTREAPLNLRDPRFANLVVGSDWSPALQALANYGDSIDGYIPPGDYGFGAAITRTVPKGLNLRGGGQGVTRLTKTADSHLFDLTIPTNARISLSDMTLIPRPGSVSAVAEAIRVNCGYQFPSLLIRDVEIAPNGVLGEFRRGVAITNGAELELANVNVRGISSGAGNEAFYFTASAAATGGSFSMYNCSSYYYGYGFRIVNAQTPGAEGFQFLQCDIVNADYGISAVDTASPYSPPMVSFLGGHINAAIRCIDIDGYSQCRISNGLIYQSGGDEFVRLNGVSVLDISHNQFMSSGGNQDGIRILGGAASVSNAVIADNIFALNPADTKWPLIAASGALHFAQIHDNMASNGTKFASLPGLTKFVVLRDNYPVDALDANETIAVAGAALDVSGLRSNFVNVVAGGSVTITSITPRRVGDVFTFQGTDHTLQHNAGIILKGSTNFVWPAGGGGITLRYDGTFWHELGRSA